MSDNEFQTTDTREALNHIQGKIREKEKKKDKKIDSVLRTEHSNSGTIVSRPLSDEAGDRLERMRTKNRTD